MKLYHINMVLRKTGNNHPNYVEKLQPEKNHMFIPNYKQHIQRCSLNCDEYGYYHEYISKMYPFGYSENNHIY